MRDLNKFKGCLIGGAVGDALGYAVEFMPAASIFKKYGVDGITEYELRNGVAEISDDTQMTLFTATGLLLGTTRGMTRGIMGDCTDYITRSYSDWYRTQTESYPLPEVCHYSWLVNLPQMFQWRAPGNTCLSALSQGGNGRIESPINQSKGCGGIMRVAPIGLYFCDKSLDPSEVDMIAAKSAALTHGHELGYIPSAMLAHIILRIAELGEGWVAEETLAIAVYCALKYADDFEKAVIAAVNHDGDSDSTGAVAGNILGASLGYDAIPKKFIENLELKDTVSELAENLCNDCQMTEHDRDEVWKSKYIRMDYGAIK